MKRILNILLENRRKKNDMLQEETNFNNTRRELRKTIDNIHYYFRWEENISEVE
ncbi:hypothetical protein ACIQYL_20400 [Lysinibacillus xylanilyticus]|uniref:hypothetical protein n=1 Tax=Lysinibacillus xylanilyticus TaxID=582475 RepID=UPI0037FF143C